MDSPTLSLSDISAIDKWIDEILNWEAIDQLEGNDTTAPSSQIQVFTRWFMISALLGRCVVIIYLSFVAHPHIPGLYSIQKSFYAEINVGRNFRRFSWSIDLEWC